MDLYGEELRVWKECWVLWEGEAAKRDQRNNGTRDVEKIEEIGEKRDSVKMPGSFEW